MMLRVISMGSYLFYPSCPLIFLICALTRVH